MSEVVSSLLIGLNYLICGLSPDRDSPQQKLAINCQVLSGNQENNMQGWQRLSSFQLAAHQIVEKPDAWRLAPSVL